MRFRMTEYYLCLIGWNLLFACGIVVSICYGVAACNDTQDKSFYILGAALLSIALLDGSVMWHIKPWDGFLPKTVESGCR